MLARLLPIFTLIAAAILAFSLYANGTFSALFDHSVSVAVAKRDTPDGAVLRASNLELREVDIDEAPAGAVIFPKGATLQAVEAAFAGQQVGRPITKGETIINSMMGKKTSYVVLRSTVEIAPGENITLRNIEAFAPTGNLPHGAIVFENEDKALSYVNESYDLVAKGSIIAGKLLAITDTAGGSEKVYVVRASRVFDREEPLSIDGLEVAEIQSRDLPRGSIAFPSAATANLFAATADRYVASESLPRGGFITADVIASNNGQVILPSGDLPRTMAELAGYMMAFPDRAMIINANVMLDEEPKEGGLVDVWVEDSRTGAPDSMLGEIRLQRVEQAVPVRFVYKDDADLISAQGNSNTLPTAMQDDASSGLTYWIQLDPQNTRAFQKSFKMQGRVAFIANSSNKIVDLLGNGASCSDGICSVNRRASGDLADVLAQLNPMADDQAGVNEEGASALEILDTVGPELAGRLTANGYGTLQQIANISDAEVPQVVMQMNLSSNQVNFIRRQAQLIVETPRMAREDLGLTETTPSAD